MVELVTRMMELKKQQARRAELEREIDERAKGLHGL